MNEPPPPGALRLADPEEPKPLQGAPSAPTTQRVEVDIPLATIAKVLVSLTAFWLVIQLWNVIVLVAVSLMLVATFNPMVRSLQQRISRRWALGTVIVGILCSVGVMVSLVVPILLSQAVSLLTHLPAYAQSLQVILIEHGAKFDVRQTILNAVTTMAEGLPQLVNVLSNLFAYIVQLLTLMLLTIYLLIEGPEVSATALRLLPPQQREGTRQLFADMGVQVGLYVRGQLILSTMAGMYFLCLLAVLRVPDALVLAMVAALADVVPLVGLLIALVPACLAALAVSPATAALVATLYLCYHLLEANLFAPRIFGQSLGLSVSVIVVAILVGAHLMGPAGALLALPFTAALPAVFRYLSSWHERNLQP